LLVKNFYCSQPDMKYLIIALAVLFVSPLTQAADTLTCNVVHYSAYVSLDNPSKKLEQVESLQVYRKELDLTPDALTVLFLSDDSTLSAEFKYERNYLSEVSDQIPWATMKIRKGKGFDINNYSKSISDLSTQDDYAELVHLIELRKSKKLEDLYNKPKMASRDARFSFMDGSRRVAIQCYLCNRSPDGNCESLEEFQANPLFKNAKSIKFERNLDKNEGNPR
jgi:hypothetical protein